MNYFKLIQIFDYFVCIDTANDTWNKNNINNSSCCSTSYSSPNVPIKLSEIFVFDLPEKLALIVAPDTGNNPAYGKPETPSLEST